MAEKDRKQAEYREQNLDGAFSFQPLWRVEEQRSPVVLTEGGKSVRVRRFDMMEDADELDCFPGLGQLGIEFSVQQDRPSAYLFGVLPNKDRVPVYGARKILMLQFAPGAFSDITRIPSSEISPYGVELESVLPWSRGIIERINAAESEEEQIRLVKAFLRECEKHHAVGRKERTETLALDIVRYMMDHRRIMKMQELEAEFGYSARSLQSTVRDCVGIGPKQLNLQICFQSAMQRLLKSESESLAEISQLMEFYDQSHFNRVFLKMTGIRPTELRKLEKRPPRYPGADRIR